MFPPEIAAKIKDFPVAYPPIGADIKDLCKEPFSIAPSNPGSDILARPLPGTQEPGYSAIYRSNGWNQSLLSTYHPSIQTIYDILCYTVEHYGDLDFLGSRQYDSVNKIWSKDFYYLSYAQAHQQALNVGSGIAYRVAETTGITADKKYIIGMYLPNCPQWIITDIACMTQTLTTVSLYDTLGANTSEYILNLCEAPVVVASFANLPNILRLKAKLPKLAVVVCSEELNETYARPGNHVSTSLKTWASDVGVELYSWSEIQEIGEKNPQPIREPGPSDTYAINFTSGTTGVPKGAILTHSCFVSAVTSSRAAVKLDTSGVETGLCFLPLAHIYERQSMWLFVSYRFRLGFPHGSVLELMDDIATLKPSTINLVPRVLNRIATVLKVATIEASGLAGAVSRKAHRAKLQRLRETGSPRHPIWDRLWSNSIRKKIGFDNVKIVVSGSAPIAPETIEFLKVALAIDLIQGYGLTESVANTSVTPTGELDSGNVGPIGCNHELRLRDIPDLKYFSSDKPRPRGEVMLRGPNIFKGYYKNPEKTDEAYDKDGWFYTGDVAEIDERGRIYIIDRVKNFFKLAQGEYVAAEKIENLYLSHTSLINQIFVHGDSTKDFLIGVCALNPDAFAPWVANIVGQSVSATDIAVMNKIAKDPKVRKAFLAALNGSLTPGLLNGFEKVKNVILGIDPLTLDNGCLTPTMKVIRSATVTTYKSEIDALYNEGPIDQKTKL